MSVEVDAMARRPSAFMPLTGSSEMSSILHLVKIVQTGGIVNVFPGTVLI
jgi:hypothetical protein